MKAFCKSIKQVTIIGFLGLALIGCFPFDEGHEERKLTKDFWLNWWGEEANQVIVVSKEPDGNAGDYVVKNTVFAVGYNNNFIIAKQHPDKEYEIYQRIFGSYREGKIEGDSKRHWEIKNLADTVYLYKDDIIYQDSGKWYHISNGWNPPDSLKPYKKFTYFHIVDIRNYNRNQSKWNSITQKWDGYEVYTFEKEVDFINKRKELGVPDSLTFAIVNKELE